MSQASELLSQRESEWRRPLRAASLVAEIGASDDQALEVLDALGTVYRDTERYDRRSLLTRRFPACMVAGTAGIGAIGYEHGDYWTALRKALGQPAGGIDQTAWGEAFRANLDRFHLARFPGFPLVNLGEILMHAGIPVYCLGDLLNLLLERERHDPDLSAEGFLDWALAAGGESRLFAVDKPVRNFLRYGGDYAEDLLDRFIDLLDRLRQPVFIVDDLDLPARLIGEARRLAESGRLALAGTRRRASADRPERQRPHLELEPFGRGVLVWLPPIPEAAGGQALWQLRAGDDVQSIPSRSVWPGSHETAPATTVPLPRPVRELSVAPSGYEQRYELQVVNPDDPLLVFTDDGRRVPATSSVPPVPVWLLYPTETADGKPAALHFDGVTPELADAPAPYGWLGWVLRRVDLRQVGEFWLDGGSKRRVKGARRAQLDLVAPLVGVAGASGAPVLAVAPGLTLPTDPGAITEWTIRVRDAGTGQVLSTRRLEVESDTRIDPWADLPRPLVGRYEVVVRGPLGRGLSRVVEMAEGLGVTSNPSWREMRVDGLEPATVRAIVGSRGLSVEPVATALSAQQPSAEFEIRGTRGSSVIRVTPPYMAVQRLAPGSRADWSLRPLRLDTETVGDGQLLVRLPHAADSRLVVRVRDHEVQDLAPAASWGQPIARFALDAIADTVAAHGSAHLKLRLDRSEFPVARVTPRRLATAVRVEDGRLVLVDGVAADGLVAGLYRVYAPWAPPHVAAIGTDLTSEPLPPEIAAGGPLVALLRVEDPWLPTGWPDWPGPENAFDIPDVPWLPAGQDAVADEVSGWLAGAGALPDRSDATPVLLRLYGHAGDLSRRGVTVDVRQAVADMLGRHPEATLAAIAGTSASASELVAPLVHSGLVAMPPTGYLDESGELALWAVSPLAGMLASAHRLSDLPDAGPLREAIIASCGKVTRGLLAGEPDPYAPVGRFDQSAEWLANMPPDQRDQVWRAMRVVPGGLLDGDERVVAARQLFDVRDKPSLRRVASRAQMLLQTLTDPLAAAGGPVVTAAVRARLPDRGWQALPALSLALAFTARLAARGDATLRTYLRRAAADHAALARSAPHLTMIDLVLAEFTLAGSPPAGSTHAGAAR